MWLIDTDNLVLKDFHQCPVDAYAILSHTWGSGADELNFDEFKAGQGRHKSGFRKIQLCCKQAKRDGLRYAWVDTCCIDKRSSAELSEAINSMFNWYHNAKLCYVYLSDVHQPTGLEKNSIALSNSHWFTRGWTLQELIAPQTIVFYDREWNSIGDRLVLAQEIHTTTQIAVEILTSSKKPRDYSIAQRMSWASNRQTTRLEDVAYCLIGLFDINMPLLYGEGQKAFRRLQEEIIRQTGDETIFAWSGTGQGSSLLASNPIQFAESGRIESKKFYEHTPHIMTPQGLTMQCRMLPWEMNLYVVFLQCEDDAPGPSSKRIGMFVCRTVEDMQYRRVPYRGQWLWKSIPFDDLKSAQSTIFVRDTGAPLPAPHPGLPTIHIDSKLPVWHLPVPSGSDTMAEMDEARDGSLPALPTWSPKSVTQLKLTSQDLENGVVLAFASSTVPLSKIEYHLELGFDRGFRPVCILYPAGFKLITKRTFDILRNMVFAQSLHVLPTFGNFWCNESHDCGLKVNEEGSARAIVCPTCYPRIMSRSGPPVALLSLIPAILPRRWYRPVMHRVRGNRSTGLKFSSSKLAYLGSRCVRVEITFKRMQGLDWHLQVNEMTPNHPHLVWLCSQRILCHVYVLFIVWLIYSVLAKTYNLLEPASFKETLSKILWHCRSSPDYIEKLQCLICRLMFGLTFAMFSYRLIWNALFQLPLFVLSHCMPGTGDVHDFYSSTDKYSFLSAESTRRINADLGLLARPHQAMSRGEREGLGMEKLIFNLFDVLMWIDSFWWDFWDKGSSAIVIE